MPVVRTRILSHRVEVAAIRALPDTAAADPVEAMERVASAQGEEGASALDAGGAYAQLIPGEPAGETAGPSGGDAQGEPGSRPRGRREPPGVLLVHDAWGLDAEVEMLAAQLADAGLAVLAPDLLGGRRARDAEEARALGAGLDPEDGARLLAGAADVLSGDVRVRRGPIGALGIGMGAPLAIFLATLRPEVSVVVASGPVPDLPLDAWDRATAEVVVLVDGNRSGEGVPGGTLEDEPGVDPADTASALLDHARAAGRKVEVRRLGPQGEAPASAAITILADRLGA